MKDSIEQRVKFEYAYKYFEGGVTETSNKTLSELNRLGDDGWQLVSQLHDTHSSRGSMAGIFMREKNFLLT